MNLPKGPNKWMVLLNIPFQMGFTIVIFSYLGKWLDGKFQNAEELYFKICTLFGVFISMYLVIKQVNKLNNNK